MIQLIAFIVFIISGIAIAFILFKKAPVLIQLPENGHHGIKKHRFIVEIERKIKNVYLHIFEKRTLSHKFLSKLKVLILKFERKIDDLLHGIRKNVQELERTSIRKKKKK